jgi:hypothetical protein
MSHPESKESDGTSTHTERALQKTAFALPFGSLRAFLDQIQFVVRLLLTSTRQIYLQCRPRYRNVVKTTYVPPVVQRGMRKLQSSHCLLGAMGTCGPRPPPPPSIEPPLCLQPNRQGSLWLGSPSCNCNVWVAGTGRAITA